MTWKGIFLLRSITQRDRHQNFGLEESRSKLSNLFHNNHKKIKTDRCLAQRRFSNACLFRNTVTRLAGGQYDNSFDAKSQIIRI